MLIINYISIINIFIICSYLCFRKNNILPNYILALIFIIPGLYFVDNILILNGALEVFPYAFFIVQIIASLFPPAVYFYVHLLLTDNKKYHKILLLGSAALLAYVLFLTLDFFLLPESEKKTYINGLNTEENYPTSMMLYTVFFYAWQMVCFFILVLEIKKYIASASDSFSNFDQLKITYVKKLITLLGILNLGLVVLYITLPLPVVDYGFLPSAVTVIYLFIIYCAIRYNAIFSKDSYESLIKENASIINFPKEEAEASSDSLIRLGKQIEDLLKNEKIYCNPDFRLNLLAEKLNEPSYVVSQAWNRHFKKTFYELTNELRINEAQERLKNFDNQKYTIESLAFDVGFNSRAAFYRSFKRFTGKIPSDFFNTTN